MERALRRLGRARLNKWLRRRAGSSVNTTARYNRPTITLIVASVSLTAIALAAGAITSAAWLGLTGVPNSERDHRSKAHIIATRTESPKYSHALSFASNALLNAPENLATNLTSSSQASLTWSAPSGTVDHYQIERSQSLSGPFIAIGTSETTSFNDNGVTAVNSYLYRVRAIDNFGAPSPPSNVTLATAIAFLNPELTANVTEVRAQHIYDLRDAVDAVRAIAGLPAATWDNSVLEGQLIRAGDIQELRNELGPALSALMISVAPYEDPTLSTGSTGTLIKKVHIEQLRERSTRGQSTSSGPSDSGVGFASARLDPMNRTGGGGEDPLSRNFNWSMPLVSLPGRAGLDLGLSLSYNSLATWTKSGTSISFDDDFGFPGPGFRLGFPTIQGAHYNAQAGKYSFLLITSSGGRVELQQVGSSNLYQAVDSSYLLLDADTMTLKAPDGTHLSYLWKGRDYQCTKITDRNGNFITVVYDGGRIDKIVDTLAREVKFVYTSNDLTSITQTWTVNGQQQPTHTWATFTYANQPIQTNFTGLTMIGAQNGATERVLTKVAFPDGSHFDFDYTSWGQVWKVRQYATATDDHLMNYRSYNLPIDSSGAQTDCPRFTQRKDWAANWNRNISGVEQEAVTTFAVPSSATIPDLALTGTLTQVTFPNLTYQRIYFGTATAPGWQNGLPLLSESYDVTGPRQRWSFATWTQDDPSLAYQLNPRVTETNVHDSSNRARTRVDYATFSLPDTTTIRLPQDVYEYQGNASTVLRRTHTNYKTDPNNPALLDPTYVNANRRIIGLVSEKTLYGVNPTTGVETLMSKVGYQYDETDSIQGADEPVQHDNEDYSASFSVGRANLSSTKRFDVTSTDSTTLSLQYNTAGSVVKATDADGHFTQISYADAFAANGTNLDSVTPLTLAYPTEVIDPDGFKSRVRYNYQFGAPTWKQTPRPNVDTPAEGNQDGPVQVTEYDEFGRLKKILNTFNNAYTKFIYGLNYVETFGTVNNVADEAHSVQVFDGHGRVIGKAGNHPGSVGGFSGQLTIYDTMGRAIKQSNPTETAVTISPTAPIQPYNWVAAGDDAAAGWIYTQQTYDWKGRPRVATNQDGTYKEASYSGCGCAGGEVVTLQDEGTVVSGELKRRSQKIYSDVLGRQWKTEVLNWDGSVFSTGINVFNGRDQVLIANQYAGSAPAEASSTNTDVACPSGTCQKTSMTYDGYGRLQAKHVPKQNVGTATLYTYNSDDTILSVTDARGASATYEHNNRHLVTSISHSAPSGITAVSPVSVEYDAAGNRLSMNDGSGLLTYAYDALSRLQTETKSFNGVTGFYALGYGYNLAGEVTSVTDPTNASINYSHDSIGRVNSVTGSPYGTGGFNGVPYVEVSQYATDLQYRASGSTKGFNYGNGLTWSLNYDSRLRPTDFEIAGRPPEFGPPTAMKSQYQYHSDGNLKYAQDFLDQRFDRAFSFDHIGALKEAYSGSEARDYVNNTSGATPSGPFRQSYQHDAFGNMTNRTNRFWSRNDTFSASYLNDRREDALFQYDAAGNLTQDADLHYAYDAAGRNSSIFNPVDSKTITPTYDGLGRPVVRAETVDAVTTTQRYVWSSVLGKIVTELTNTGTKLKTYVYLGGQTIARQESGWVVWQHDNPITGSRGTSNRDGGYNAELEPDPMGIDVGFYDPFIEFPLPPPPTEGGSPILMGDQSGCGNNPNCTRCYMDGFEIGCADAFHLMDIGAAQFHTPTTVYVTYTSGRTQTFTGYTDLPPGSFFNFTGDYARSAAYVFGILSGNFNVAVHTAIASADVVRNSRMDISGRASGWYGPPMRGGEPQYYWLQTPRQFEPDAKGIRQNIANALEDPDCANFIKALLNGAASSDNPLVEGGDLLKVLDVIMGQNGMWRARMGEGGTQAWPSVAQGTGGIRFGNVSGRFSSADELRETLLRFDSYAALHELIHLAGFRSFGDDVLARAASKLPNAPPLKEIPFPYGGTAAEISSYVYHYSDYWDDELRKHCSKLKLSNR